jgi:hypothetical protein
MALGGLKTETVETHCHVDEQFVDIERTWLPPSEAYDDQRHPELDGVTL